MKSEVDNVTFWSGTEQQFMPKIVETFFENVVAGSNSSRMQKRKASLPEKQKIIDRAAIFKSKHDSSF